MSIRLIVAAFAICLAPLVSSAADDDFNPYKNAKVGDFVTYKVNAKLGTISIAGATTQAVIAKTDKEATIKVTMTVNGMDVPAQTQTIDLTKPYDPTKAVSGLPAGTEASVKKLPQEGKEKVKVAGKEYETTWNTYEVKAKVGGTDITSTCKVWMSRDIPLGIVKIEMTDAGQKLEMTMEVVETGNKKQ